MVSGSSELAVAVEAMRNGAEDYVTKPFSPRELVARVRSVLRRSGAAQAPESTSLEYDGITLDHTTREVTAGGDPVDLTAKEFDLLLHFACHPGQVFTRSQLLDQVWGLTEFIDPSTVTVHVRRLREKIEADPGNPRYIQTVWGVGYRFPSTEELGA